MLEVYRAFSEETLAMPVIAGEKAENRALPRAVATYSIEAMMQDGKALPSRHLRATSARTSPAPRTSATRAPPASSNTAYRVTSTRG